jgi:hypothetical protein
MSSFRNWRCIIATDFVQMRIHPFSLISEQLLSCDSIWPTIWLPHSNNVWTNGRIFVKLRVNIMLLQDTIYLWLYSPLLDLGRFFNFLIFFTQSVGLLGRGITGHYTSLILSSLQEVILAWKSYEGFGIKLALTSPSMEFRHMWA